MSSNYNFNNNNHHINNNNMFPHSKRNSMSYLIHSGIKDLVQSDTINTTNSRNLGTNSRSVTDSGYQTQEIAMSTDSGAIENLQYGSTDEYYSDLQYHSNPEESVNSSLKLKLSEEVFNLKMEVNSLKEKNEELEQKNELYRNQIDSHNIRMKLMKDEHNKNRKAWNKEKEELEDKVTLNQACVRSLTEEKRNISEKNFYQERKIKDLERQLALYSTSLQNSNQYLYNNYNQMGYPMEEQQQAIYGNPANYHYMNSNSNQQYQTYLNPYNQIPQPHNNNNNNNNYGRLEDHNNYQPIGRHMLTSSTSMNRYRERADPTLKCHFCNIGFNYGEIQQLRDHLNSVHPIRK